MQFDHPDDLDATEGLVSPEEIAFFIAVVLDDKDEDLIEKAMIIVESAKKRYGLEPSLFSGSAWERLLSEAISAVSLSKSLPT